METRSVLAASALLLAVVGCRDSDFPTGPVPTTPEAAVTAASALTFWQVSAGYLHTCGVTPDYQAYCWGGNDGFQLGDSTPFNRSRPVAVLGGVRLRNVSGGRTHTCGVSPDYRAYCWGSNARGQLGDGTENGHYTPNAVTGGLHFRKVDAGWEYSCGVTYPDYRAYCWGDNSVGQLGDGTTTYRTRPVAVLGGLHFKEVRAGYTHTCGITTTNRAYCWGRNEFGQLGDSTTVNRLRPVRVAAGTRQFRQVDVGRSHSCAVTPLDRAFCWGNGRSGAIGDGKSHLSYWPRAVAGGLYFGRVSAGAWHTCAETTTGNRAYCWGDNYYGQLGDGTTTLRLAPVPVVGALSFSQVTAEWLHSCGKTTAGVAYCWGDDYYGQLGDGRMWGNSPQTTPVPVLGPM